MNRRRRVGVLLGGGLVCLVAIVGTVVAALFALAGADLGCGSGGTALAATGPAPTRTALREIPSHFLALYREAGSALDISWPFLASIGDQECGFGTGNCYVVAPSGCAGPMEIAYVRGSECSPDKNVPTIWERFRTDGNGDGKTEIFNDADSIFTAAKILRESDGAPPVGGSYSAYHEAACNYYGACSDASANYADEVMARAVSYGFGGTVEKKAPGTEEGHAGAGGVGGAATDRRDRVSKHGAGGVPPGEEAAGSRGGRGGAPASGQVCEGSGVVPSTASGSRIVQIAESQLGYHEYVDEEGVGNCQKYGPCESWCALFLYWVWERAGVPLEGGPPERAYSGSPYEWVREHGGRDLPPTATPAPGDAVMYGEGANLPGEGMAHVGIVAEVFPDGEITTIAGNFGDAVTLSGPFDPARAVAEGGQPAAIFAYAEPPTVGSKDEPGGAKAVGDTHGAGKGPHR